MSICLNCGAEFEGEVGLCAACRKTDALHRAKGAWKKQMKFYGVLMAIGLAIIAYAFPQLQASHGEASRQLYMISALGGLFLLGGLFGFSLAIFFHLWHGHRH